MHTRLLVVIAAAAAMAGCAANETFREGRALVEAGAVEEGLARIEEALAADPHDREMRNFYLRNRAVAVQRYLAVAENARRAGAFDSAQAAYQRALRFEPDSARAQQGLAALALERRSAVAAAEAESLLRKGESEAAYAKAKQILGEDPRQRTARAIVRKVELDRIAADPLGPKLRAALEKTISIELREAPVRAVFDLIAKRTGLNFIFDKDVPTDLRTTVFVRDASIADVLRFVLVSSQLERRVLNENTLLIYPNTPQKLQAHRDLVVRSFYLDSADARQAANMVRSLVKTRDLYVDEKLNLLVIRDTPEAVRAVERLIAAQDIAEAEVMLEVEVLEVGQSLLAEIGIQWPSSASLTLIGAAGVPGQITGVEARQLGREDWRLQVNDPFFALQLREVAGRSNILANPRIRVKNREKARIHIGDKVPVITTTAGATGFVSETVNYLDVGLKLEVEPTVHLEGDVGIRVGLEVSNISNEVTSGAGTVAYQVGTRNAATVLRLRDGETQVLAGLVSDEDRRSVIQVPGLAQLPVLGRLFRANNDNLNKTEIVLLITPRVVRHVERPGAETEHFSAGTELELGSAAGAAGEAEAAPAVQPPVPQPPAPQPYAPQPPASAPQPPASAPSPLLPPTRP